MTGDRCCGKKRGLAALRAAVARSAGSQRFALLSKSAFGAGLFSLPLR